MTWRRLLVVTGLLVAVLVVVGAIVLLLPRDQLSVHRFGDRGSSKVGPSLTADLNGPDFQITRVGGDDGRRAHRRDRARGGGCVVDVAPLAAQEVREERESRAGVALSHFNI